MKRLLFTLAVFSFVAFGAFADAKGDQIATEYFALKKPKDTSANAVMTLVDRSGNKKVRKLDLMSKDTGSVQSSFTEFTEPADVKGTKFLTTKVDGKTEQRLFLPALNKVRKIASSDKSGEFVNSDLTYYDMEARDFGDSTYTFLAENETLADKAFEGLKFYKIEMKSTDASSPYSKSIAWIEMKNKHMYKIEVYDKKDGALWKTIQFVKFETVDGLMLPVQTLVTNHKKGSKTYLQLNNLKVNTGLSDSVFSIKNLEQ